MLTPFECASSISTDGLCLSVLGFDLCAVDGLDLGDPFSVLQGFLSQINAALVPLSPVFAIFDVIMAIVDCIKAIPASLGPPPDPTAIIKAIAALVKKLTKILGMLPQFSVPKMVKQILTTIATTYLAIQREMLALVDATERLLIAATMSAKEGNSALATVVSCAQGQIDVRMGNLAMAMGPINRLIALVNLLMDLAQLPKDARPPTFDGFGASAADTLEPLGKAATFLLELASNIPG